MWPFKPKIIGVEVVVKPLKGVGCSKKQLRGFIKKYFGKCGNADAVLTYIDTMEKRSEKLELQGEIPLRLARKLSRNATSLGVDVELNVDHEDLFGSKENIRDFFSKKRKSWVVC